MVPRLLSNTLSAMLSKLGFRSTRKKAQPTEIDDPKDSQEADPKPIKIHDKRHLHLFAFLDDGKHIVSGDLEGEIWRWSIKDGEQVGRPMNTRRGLRSMAVSCNAKWIMTGMQDGFAAVWNLQNGELVMEFSGHKEEVGAVDISPDGTRVATGSNDKTGRVWSMLGGQQLFGPLKHDDWLTAAKFSPDGLFIATATFGRNSGLCVYDGWSGSPLFDVPIKVRSSWNHSLTWALDSRQLFALSHDGNLICLEPPNCTTLWKIPISHDPTCISLASNGLFIAASSNSSISFWDTSTRERINPASELTTRTPVGRMVMSANFDIGLYGRGKIDLRDLRDVLPSDYVADVDVTQHIKPEVSGTSISASGNHPAILTSEPVRPNDISEQSDVQVVMGSWKKALIDADKVIKLDPSSYNGYERKYIALRGLGHHIHASMAFKRMLSILEQSRDLSVQRELRDQYIEATHIVERAISANIRHMPRVLIDTSTGRLCNKTNIAAAFGQLPFYDELQSSKRPHLDSAGIRREVKKFYRYVMFSHRWEDGEPLFQEVENISVYSLKPSPANTKLQTFCELARSLGFRWVWSDTCCIDKRDHVVLQESLVAMFTWYRGASLVIAHLRGVRNESQRPGDLKESIWNTRGWTYQEYVAARVVRFYTEDWKLYLGLEMFNHKESPLVISEMEWSPEIAAQNRGLLHPGLERVREKLFLASTRHTTLVEDAAYSLLGIFGVSLPVIYGEGNRAVGRLLDNILTGSGDATILAWTGHAGSYNSCLPSNLSVYRCLVPSHVPQPITMIEMDNRVTLLRLSLPDPSQAVKLYDTLIKLPSPSFNANRLQLPGIIFPIEIRSPDTLGSKTKANSNSDVPVYHATATALGNVEIKTTEDLSEMSGLLLSHPWISTLLEQEFERGTDKLDRTTRALQLVERLRQPFGALLLAPVSRMRYRRVATDCLIMVQVHKEASLDELIGGIDTVNIQ